MKLTTFFLIAAFVFSFSAINAQTYKLNKEVYDHRLYIPQFGDPNNPTVSGLCSFFIPGLGQMISGETGRGIAFLGSSIALSTLTFVGLYNSTEEVMTHNEFGTFIESKAKPGVVALSLTALAATLAVDIWAIVDAVKVAKVNNMYIQDRRKEMSSVKLEMNPFIDSKNYLGENNTSAGLTFKVTF